MSLQISHRGPLSSESTSAVVPAPSTDNWQPIYHLSNQVVLYNPQSHALSIRHFTPPAPSHSENCCPYCHRPFEQDGRASSNGRGHDEWDRAANYFQLLEVAHETSSRPATPPLSERSDDDDNDDNMVEGSDNSFPKSSMAEGYFEAFFREACLSLLSSMCRLVAQTHHASLGIQVGHGRQRKCVFVPG
jgi:hypothetical protein